MARKYMKIAMVGQKRVPSHDGGIEVVVGELAKRMVAQGHSVTCYNRTDKQQPQPENFNGISLKYVPTIQKKGLAAVSASFFGCLCAAVGNYDVVHVHAEGPAAVLLAAEADGQARHRDGTRAGLDAREMAKRHCVQVHQAGRKDGGAPRG